VVVPTTVEVVACSVVDVEEGAVLVGTTVVVDSPSSTPQAPTIRARTASNVTKRAV
jgi:hypothetical protein